MGGFLDKPKTEKHNEDGVGPSGLSYGLSSMQGWRMEMEDAHCAVTGLSPRLKDWSFFAVFDGHAGGIVSEHCAKKLLESILLTCEEHLVNNDVEKVREGIREGFLKLDEELKKLPSVESGEDKSGSTVVCALIGNKHIFIGNCGDSRAVIAREGKVVFMSQDHKPILPSETQRIENAGGSVMVQRVNGSLAVSRALGDFVYKQVEGKGPTEQLVSPEPEITVQERQLTDEFLILACDGIWDVMSNDDVCEFIRSRLKVTESLSQVANEVVDTCLYKGSQDNMSIVLVKFEGAPKLDEAAVEADKQLDKWIESNIENLFKEHTERPEIETIREALNSREDKPAFPPGGGIHAKHHIMERTLDKLFPPEESKK